mgnify:FL=1
MFKSADYVYREMVELAKALRTRFQGHDDEINAIKEQMATTQKEIDALQTELKMLKCQPAVAQRQSLAQKLREKGVTK